MGARGNCPRAIPFGFVYGRAAQSQSGIEGAALIDVTRTAARNRHDEFCRRFMTIPGVDPVTASAFKSTVNDPARFRRASDVGAHLDAKAIPVRGD